MRESLDLRDWEKATQRIHEWEAEGRPVAPVVEKTIEQACKAFEADAKARGLREPTLKKHRALFKQLREFGSDQGIRFIKECDLAVLRKFRESWTDSDIRVEEA